MALLVSILLSDDSTIPVNTYVDCGVHAAQQPVATLSMSCWFKQTADNSKTFGLFPALFGVWDDTISDDSYQTLSAYDGGNPPTAIAFEINGGARGAAIDGANTLNTWDHFVYTYDGGAANGTQLIYKNGVLIVTKTNVGATISYTGTNKFLIGDLFNQSGSTNGPLGDIRIYSRVLSQAEVQELYNCRGTDTVFGSLVSRYFANEGPVGSAGGAGSIKDIAVTKANGTPSHDQGAANAPWAADVIKYTRRGF